MGVMEAIRKGFGIATKGFALILILFVFNAIWSIGSIPFATQTPAAAGSPASAVAIVFSVVFLLASILMQGGTLGLVRDLIKTEALKLNLFISYGLKFYLRLLGIGLVVILVVGIAALLAVLLIAGTAPLNNQILTIVATVVAVIIGGVDLYFVVLLLMAPYALVCEDLGVVAALKRSVGLVKKNLLKVFLLLVLLVLISLGIGFVVGFVTGLITVAMPLRAGQTVIGVVNSAFNGYLGVVMIAAFMNFYLSITSQGSAPVSPLKKA